MASFRCHIPPESWPAGPELWLAGREAHHLSRVLRVRAGDSLACFDGKGREAEGTVREAAGGSVLVDMGPARQSPPLPWTVSLGFAIPGQGKLEEIINSATQLGVSELIPLLTERTVVQFTPERSEKKRAHLQQVAIEAAKQSGVSRLPEISAITSWRKFLPSLSNYDRVVIGAVEGPHEDWKALLAGLPDHSKVLLLIGPEGDFTPQEMQEAFKAGARPVSLGPTVLRCDTAVTSSLSILLYLLRESSHS